MGLELERLNTGKLVAGPFECAGIVGAVRFSQDSRKLAKKSGVHGLEVWDIQEQKLDGRVGKHSGGLLGERAGNGHSGAILS